MFYTFQTIEKNQLASDLFNNSKINSKKTEIVYTPKYVSLNIDKIDYIEPLEQGWTVLSKEDFNLAKKEFEKMNLSNKEILEHIYYVKTNEEKRENIYFGKIDMCLASCGNKKFIFVGKMEDLEESFNEILYGAEELLDSIENAQTLTEESLELDKENEMAKMLLKFNSKTKH